jgi:hypothetical protein
MFPKRVISLRGELPWPTRSPDLSACDYFLWRYLKEKVHATRPRNIDDLKIAIRKQISATPENIARRALGNLWARLGERIRNDGQHFSGALLKTINRDITKCM